MAENPFTARPITRSLSDFAHTLEFPGDSEERLRHALTLLHEIVPCDVCALVETVGEQCEVLAIPEPSEEDKDTIRTALLSRLREFQERPDLLGTQEPKLAQGLSLLSHLAVPLVAQDKVIGLLFIGQRAPNAYGEQELSLLSIVAAQIAAHLAARTFREQEARHLQRITFQAHILNMVEQAVIAADLEGKITYWNRYAQTLFGWSADE
ncbi:MAG: GAF domain-containing protein, partial [Chloroflexi bacterium]|nr:GAF domain-containing protein [Chloroflexota bacterium]